MAETPVSIQGSNGYYRLSLVVSYRGTEFRGFAANDDHRTVEASLIEALSTYCGERIEIEVAGRTDKGVHATGQVVSFDVPDTVGLSLDPSSTGSLAGLVRAVNKMCKPDISVRDVRRVPPNFSARFSAIWRQYRYTIVNSPIPDPFRIETAWQIRKEMNLAAAEAASTAVVGFHDFSSFCRKPSPFRDGRERDLHRTIFSAEWSKGEGDLVYFDLRGSAFCHQMVRSMVGTLVDVAIGRLKANHVRTVLNAKDRDMASNVAPARGLCLVGVGYPPEAFSVGPTQE